MFQRVFPILATGNLPRMLGFYRDLLGAAVTYQFEHEGQVVYAGLELGPSHLGIGHTQGLGDQPDAVSRFALWVTSLPPAFAGRHQHMPPPPPAGEAAGPPATSVQKRH